MNRKISTVAGVALLIIYTSLLAHLLILFSRTVEDGSRFVLESRQEFIEESR